MDCTVKVDFFELWSAQDCVFIDCDQEFSVACCCDCAAANCLSCGKWHIRQRSESWWACQTLSGIILHWAGSACWVTHFQDDAAGAGATFCVPILAVIDASWQERVLVVRCQVGTVVWDTEISAFLRIKRDVLELFFTGVSLSSELKGDCECGGVMNNFAFNYGFG